MCVPCCDNTSYSSARRARSPHKLIGVLQPLIIPGGSENLGLFRASSVCVLLSLIYLKRDMFPVRCTLGHRTWDPHSCAACTVSRLGRAARVTCFARLIASRFAGLQRDVCDGAPRAVGHGARTKAAKSVGLARTNPIFFCAAGAAHVGMARSGARREPNLGGRYFDTYE